MTYTRKLSRHGVNVNANGDSLRHVALCEFFWPLTTASSVLRVTCQLHAEFTTTPDSVMDDYYDEMKHRMTDSDDVVVFPSTTDQPPVFTYQPNALKIPYCSQLVYFTSRNPHRFIMLYKIFDRSKDDNTLIKSPSISTPNSPITDMT
jgi:hypothetical protein